MRTFYTLLALLFVFTSNLSSQVIESKITRYNGPPSGDDIPRRMISDAEGNVYVTGGSEGYQSSFDYVTIKYDNKGDIVWVKRYNGPGNGHDEAFGIAIDGTGNVFITGWSVGSDMEEDLVTIKYSSSGTEEWVSRYSSPDGGNARGMAVGVDDMGNSYSGGWLTNANGDPDYVTIKNSPGGAVMWTAIVNGTGDGEDCITRINVKGNGDVVVAGHSEISSGNKDLLTIKYNTNGTEQWRSYCSGLVLNTASKPYHISRDNSDNIYVTGESYTSLTESCIISVKYDTNGNEVWVNRYNGPSAGIDYANIILPDKDGSVYVAGSSNGINTGFDYCVIKYNSSGEELWVRRYDGPVSMFDCINGMAIDKSGNVCVTGRSFGGYGLTNNDFYTIKYSSSGESLWEVRYNSGPDASDYGANLALDEEGNVFVAGWSDGMGQRYDYVLIKYVDNLTGVHQTGNLPQSFELYQNYPNPFNPTTKIKFDIPENGSTKLTLYNASGMNVATLLNKDLAQGQYEVNWNAADFPSGIYFYQLVSGNLTQVKKMILVK